jgi:hypothetical protein
MKNTCLSGGANGADIQWGNSARKAGHIVIHWSFVGHNSRAPENELIRLTEEQLSKAEVSVILASKSLGKHPPKSFFPRNLIYRNFYQIATAERLYAIATIQDNIVQGGTGWAVQMFIDRYPTLTAEAYVYCQVAEKWYKIESGTWEEIDQIPMPHGTWAGIGSRNLTLSGCSAIIALFDQ